MKKIIKKIIPKKHHKLVYNFFGRLFTPDYKKSYSQSGEDMILNKILYKVKRGFYVDVGANNPTKLSNTHFFYKKGWNGINIDALPGSMKKFNRMRSRDINLEIPISDKQEILKYYMFSHSFYNTFSEEIAITLKDRLIGTTELQTEKLSLIFDKYLKNRKIDFMTIDVEGLDFQVIKSNDWTRYRPKLIIIELRCCGVETITENEITKFLREKGYSFYSFSNNNIFYIENEFYKIRFPLKYNTLLVDEVKRNLTPSHRFVE